MKGSIADYRGKINILEEKTAALLTDLQQHAARLQTLEAQIPPLTARLTALEETNKNCDFPKALADLVSQKLNEKYNECA